MKVMGYMASYRKQNRKGFTLVEMLVVMAVIAIIIGAMVKIAGHVYDNAKKDNTKNTIQLLVAALHEYENFHSQGRRNFEFPLEPYDVYYTADPALGDWNNFWSTTPVFNVASVKTDSHFTIVWDDNVNLGSMRKALANIEFLYLFLDDVPDCRKILNRIPTDVTANADNDSVVLAGGEERPLIEVNDAWGHPISYQTQGAGNFPLLRSAGKDGIFENADDIHSSEM